MLFDVRMSKNSGCYEARGSPNQNKKMCFESQMLARSLLSCKIYLSHSESWHTDCSEKWTFNLFSVSEDIKCYMVQTSDEMFSLHIYLWYEGARELFNPPSKVQFSPVCHPWRNTFFFKSQRILWVFYMNQPLANYTVLSFVYMHIFITYSKFLLVRNIAFAPWGSHTDSKTRVKFCINIQFWRTCIKHTTLKVKADYQDCHWRRFSASVDVRVKSCIQSPQPSTDVCEVALHPKE